MFSFLNSSSSKIPEICSLHITSDIQYRYAHTLVCSKVRNSTKEAQEIQFSIVLPETAFITSFCIEVDGKVYDAYVKEKEEAKKIYTEAVQKNRTAAHVAVNPRDSSRFQVSVNIEPSKDVTFHLTYEELLVRKLGLYKHVINLDPGQIVPDFNVEVNIKESTDITVLKVPELKDEDESQSDTDKTNTLAIIKRPNPHSAGVKFSPTPDQQKALAENGIKGQLIVQYDVERKLCSSQLLVNDGYFAHYFSPEDLKPLPKHVTFVLDDSGSMGGRKMQQLKEAMNTILNELNDQDYFSLLSFNNETKVWRLHFNAKWDRATEMECDWKSLVIPATKKNVQKGTSAIKKLEAGGGTNIYDSMRIATHIAQLGKNVVKNKDDKPPEPIIIFLTDGEPTVNICDTNEITDEVTRLNQKAKAAIFTLGLGRDVDFKFLKKLALRNSGFCRKIYEASDTALQLTNFYKEVASPLLSDVNFIYQPEQVDSALLTMHMFPTFFHGTEIIVCGHINPEKEKEFGFNVTGRTREGMRNFESQDTSVVYITGNESKKGFMERLWAYLTIQQLLEEEKRLESEPAAEKKRHATKLALKYSFVTPVTSLVVVKPEDTKSKSNTQMVTAESEDDDYELVDYEEGLCQVGCSMSAMPVAMPRSRAMMCSYSLSDDHEQVRCRSSLRSRSYMMSQTKSSQPKMGMPLKNMFVGVKDFFQIKKKKSINHLEQVPSDVTATRVTEEDIIIACEQEVIANGMLPSELENSEKIKELLANKAGTDNKIDIDAVTKRIHEKSIYIRNTIQEEMQNNSVSLKFDCTFEENHLFLGIHARFFDDGKLVVRTLGVCAVESNYSTQDLESILRNKLEEFGIIPEDIVYSIVSDGNAAGLAQETSNVCSKLKDNIFEMLSALGIPASRCPLDVLQLAILDTFETVDTIRTKVRNVIKELKALSAEHINCASNPTSGLIAALKLFDDFTTLQKLHGENKFKCSKVVVTEEEWKMIADIDAASLCFTSLQEFLNRENLVFNDLYRMWIEKAEEIAKLGTSFRTTLVKNMKSRANEVLQEPVFLSLLFLDPRMKTVLDEKQKKTAKEELNKLYDHILQLSKTPARNDTGVEDKLTEFQTVSQMEKDETILEYWVSQRHVQPDLYELAATLFTIPISSKTIETISSNIKILLSPMAEDKKEDIVNARCFSLSEYI